MYYCITCSEIHYERSATDKVFENGFYPALTGSKG
ncbi:MULTISPECIES: DUF3973 domain-containing protein [unclassified Bacillus (in: firmicutes)]|nr:DUF3973 domain-containing protein [Bacillus sp. BP-3]MDC2865041.1 DUF3973 domain-containing protein [Bacillus sp. BP-3]